MIAENKKLVNPQRNFLFFDDLGEYEEIEATMDGEIPFNGEPVPDLIGSKFESKQSKEIEGQVTALVLNPNLRILEKTINSILISLNNGDYSDEDDILPVYFEVWKALYESDIIDWLNARRFADDW